MPAQPRVSFYFQRQWWRGLPKINLDYLFFYSHCVLERATTAFITESHSYFLWKQAVICLQQTLNTTVSHMLRQKPEAPFPHWKKPLPLILALGFCSLCELGADSSKLLSGALVSLGAEVLSAPHRRASSSPSIGSHEVWCPLLAAWGPDRAHATFAHLLGPAAKWSPGFYLLPQWTSPSQHTQAANAGHSQFDPRAERMTSDVLQLPGDNLLWNTLRRLVFHRVQNILTSTLHSHLLDLLRKGREIQEENLPAPYNMILLKHQLSSCLDLQM